ncbi:MAG TPA: transglutaminase family protein [Chthoniobacterales bacterium]|jgi:transglutaminase-like putative cysteine protease
MTLDVYHWTEYRYAEAVPLSQHLLHMQPREFANQRVLSSHFEFTPQPTTINSRRDNFGNHVTEFFIGESHVGLHIKCISKVETTLPKVPAAAQTPAWEQVADELLDSLEADPRTFIYPSAYAPHLDILRDWARESFPAGRPVLEGVLDLTARIFREFIFDNLATSVATPLSEVFETRRGVCQDFAHLQISCLRSLGLAARYVSGYLRTQPPPGRRRVFGADASHAWVSVYCPGHGWIDIDPTNNRLITEEYATIGWGRDYGDVSLIRGILGGGGSHSLYFSVNVEVAA